MSVDPRYYSGARETQVVSRTLQKPVAFRMILPCSNAHMKIVHCHVNWLFWQMITLVRFPKNLILSLEGPNTVPQAPKVLYHYTTQTGLLGILKTDSIWATKIHYLNDASEYQLALDLASEVLRSLLSGEKSTKKRRKVKALLDNLRMIEHMNVCVCSLSARRDLLSQWRAYAGGTTGYSIGLNTACIEAQASRQGFALVQCEYNERTQKELVEQMVVESLDKDFNTTPSRIDPKRPRTIIALPVGGDFSVRFAQLAPMIKSPAFHEEDEWRLVSARGVDVRKMSFRAGTSMLTPYFDFSLGTNKASYLSSVTVGPTPHARLSERSTQSLLAHLGVAQPVQVHSSKAPYRAW